MNHIARGITRTTRFLALCFAVSAAVVVAGSALGFIAPLVDSGSYLGVLAPSFVIALAVAVLFLAIPAIILHAIATHAQRGMKAALVLNFAVVSTAALSLALPVVSWAASGLVAYVSNPSEPGLNPTARLALLAALEAVAIAVVWLVARAWWKAAQGTYVLIRNTELLRAEP
jgi:hypothetical protein